MSEGVYEWGGVLVGGCMSVGKGVFLNDCVVVVGGESSDRG